MSSGKRGNKSNQKISSRIVTRASKPSSIPKPRTPGTPKMDSSQRNGSDFQRVLDGIEDRLEAKIDDVISRQEISIEKIGE